MRKIIFLLIGIQSGGLLTVHAQADSLAGMRRFIRVCNSYKQLPLSMDVDIQRKANFVTNRGDSSQMAAVFCLHADGSYISLDGTEQLANDSLLLLVNKSTKRMILYANHQPVADRFRQYIGLRFADSTLFHMAGIYQSSEPAIFRDTGVIGLRSRTDLPQTALPREEIQVRFNLTSDLPYEVLDVKRSLFPVTHEMYLKAVASPGWSGKTIAGPDSLFFLVKEVTTIFRYRNISHDPEAGLTFRVGDRIEATVRGRYRPVKGFADYILTQQF